MSRPPFPSKATPGVAFCFLVNTLLARETWARERLEAFQGQGFEVQLPLVAPLRLVIAAGGRIEAGDAEAGAVVTPTRITGTSALADELRYLAKHVRPDVEEELSRFVGDIAAHRLVGGVRGLVQWQLDALNRIGEAAVDYAVEERRALVRRHELVDLAQQVRALDEALVRLEQKVRRLD